ncbi:MAG: hypothetical protein EZS28_044013, partial [Streblomastix strix]
DANKRPTTKQIMEQDTIKLYLRMQEEKEQIIEKNEKQQNEIAQLKSQLAKQQPQSDTSKPKPINIEPKQQRISTQPKVTSEPKIMIQPPVTQATVTQVRKVLSLVESKCLQDVKVNGDTYTNKNGHHCTLLYNPVINKGIVKFEFLNVKDLEGVGIADESVRYGRDEGPQERGKDKIVYYDWTGDFFHIGDPIWGNSNFSDGCRIGMEVSEYGIKSSQSYFLY